MNSANTESASFRRARSAGVLAQMVGIQLLPRSKVLRRLPSAVTMSATSALRAETPTISALVGDLIRCHRVPSVVSRIVPLRPTTQHTVFDGASPANKSDCTPLLSCCQLRRSVERKIVPESSSAQYTEWSGDETSTERVVTLETVGEPPLPATAPAAGAAAAAGIRAPETDSSMTADPLVAVGSGEVLAAEVGLPGEGVLADAGFLELPVGGVPLVGSKGSVCAEVENRFGAAAGRLVCRET